MPKIRVEDMFTFGTGIVVIAIALGLYSRLNKPLTPQEAAAERVLKQYDINRDGSLDREELEKLSTSVKLEAYDQDKNGSLNKQELTDLFKEYTPSYQNQK